MELSALLHLPESEYAFLDSPDSMTIRLRTKHRDIKMVELISVDPYLVHKYYFSSLNQMEVLYSTDLFDYWQIQVKAKYRRLAYSFKITGYDETVVFYSDRGIFEFNDKYYKDINYYFKLPYFHVVDMYNAPKWVENTIWYQIFPERFYNGNKTNDPDGVLNWDHRYLPSYHDYFGGDLQGIIDNLDYLKELGINGIYLTPIFKANTNHKYDTEDYFEIDPNFGDKETLKDLVDCAHKLGIRIMLDGVFNHIGYQSKFWQDVLINQEKSKYFDWFHINKTPVPNYNHLHVDEIASIQTTDYDTFAFAANMPKLNTTNTEVQSFILEVLTYWTEEFNIDAWRFDVANEVDHQFWKKVHSKLTSINPEVYLLGEAWHSARSWLNGDEFHAVMNYPLTDPIKQFLFNDEIDAVELQNRIINQLMIYKEPVNRVQFNLLDSHDTPRILHFAKENKDLAKAAMTLMFSLGGSPSIYYGTEIGLTGDHDPDNRRCMIWTTDNQDLQMLDFTKKLIEFRKNYSRPINYAKLNFKKTSNPLVLLFNKVFENSSLKFIFNHSENDYEIDLVNQSILLENLVLQEEERKKIKKNGFVVLVNSNERGD